MTNPHRRPGPRRLAALATPLLVLAAASPALAAVSPSKNWAGFVAGGPHKHFRAVAASWTAPTPHCNRTHRATAATWVGLGGVNGTALEQTGTQIFCNRGRTATLAWFELLPAPAQYLTLPVRPGDRMGAEVTVAGHRVTFTLANLSRRIAFHRTFTASRIDTSTAEWVQEAPQACTRSGRCRLLRLANFGTVRFSGTRAVDGRGHAGAISSHRWRHVQLVLFQVRRSYVNVALPTTLNARGTGFSVSYKSGA